jgi:tetratricopeptide (TPR) repeat protein/transcriptional regulator with XRE-family HTH domain
MGYRPGPAGRLPGGLLPLAGCAASVLVRLAGRVLSVPWPGVPVRGGRGVVRGGGPVREQAALSFAGLLRRLRDDAGLTQEELAEAASLSRRSVSDLERGVNLTARHDTARLLAGALGLTGPQRTLFEAAARGRAPASEVLAAGEGSAAAATRTLPRDIASFTGRAAELAQLASAVMTPASGGVVGICAIGGMAGIGKTTFAVHAAHRMADAFPDGQFFLPLHAHTPGQRPVDPADALASLLLTAGVEAQQIPPGLQARAARWRDYLAGKKVLLLLDDAAGHEQVTPLLPGTGGSLVLVTSRRHLTALEDAAAISLDTLAPDEAAALLARLAGRPALGSGGGPAGEIIRLCGYLPLAIGMLARQLHYHPAWTAADLAADLAAAAGRLELMRAENLSVAAAFDLSYQDLTAGQQRLFRRLGVHPGADIDAYAAAALDGTDLAAARRHLDGLYEHYLLAEPARGRYRLHDLLREHASALAFAGDPADADAAAGRLLDYYLHTAAAAGQHIETRITADSRPLPGKPPAVATPLSTAGRAAAWLDAEWANLHAAAGYAAASGRPGHAIAIPAVVSGFLFARGHWDQSAALLQAALATARQAGDRAGQARALNELGLLQQVTGDCLAVASHQQALELYRGLDDRLGQASALDELGEVQFETGDYQGAAASYQQALALYRDLDHQAGQAMAIHNLGTVQAQTGDYPAATASHRQALAMFRDLGSRLGQARAITDLGLVQQLTGDYPAATASHQQALAMFRDLRHRLCQARATHNLGIVQLRTGDYGAAAASFTEALGMYRDLGHRYSQAEVLNSLGEVLARSGDRRQARDHYAQALAIAREISAPLEEARALEGLGHCLLRDGGPGDAAAHWQQALAICQRIGVPDAQRIQEALRRHGITTAPSAPSGESRQSGAPTAP